MSPDPSLCPVSLLSPSRFHLRPLRRCIIVIAASVHYRDRCVLERPVAVKRLLKAYESKREEQADTEMKLLIQSDKHPNVLRYYARVLVRRVQPHVL